ncbi:MAG: holo-ACP synthase [Chlorobi bacterium]|nr:holo-ACP synthase [Chlorobiota bacterium]
MEIGVDIVELERIGRAWRRYGEAFLKRFMTVREIGYCLKKKDPVPGIAGRFAAKEALVKALGTGISGPVHWKSFEVINDSRGKPEVHLHGMVADTVSIAQVSISHDRLSAVAMAVVVKKESGERREESG